MVFKFIADPKIIGRIANPPIIELLHIGIYYENRRAIKLKVVLRNYDR